MLSAIRHDVSALASPRVIRTLQQWRAEADDDGHPDKQREALRMLESVGRALLPHADLDVFDAEGVTTAVPESAGIPEPPSDDHTIDSFQLPPKPRGLRRVSDARPDFDSGTMMADDAIVHETESDTDSRVRSAKTGASAPPGFGEEDEKPTTAFPRPQTQSREAAPVPGPPPPLPAEAMPKARIGSSSQTVLPELENDASQPPANFEEDEKPTRHIDVELAQRRIDSLGGPERTEMAAVPPSKPMPAAVVDDLDDDDDDDLESTHALLEEEVNDPKGSGRLAPKPGIIRRRSTRAPRDASSVRPRAAMHHVRALYGVLMPFAAELIPLSVERRSRRFWARWREVAGDRGVRREFAEDLLRSANDKRTLVCELISEVQSVDVKSVYALVDKLEATGELSPEVAPKPPMADRARNPLVGSSVRVEGVIRDDEG